MNDYESAPTLLHEGVHNAVDLRRSATASRCPGQGDAAAEVTSPEPSPEPETEEPKETGWSHSAWGHGTLSPNTERALRSDWRVFTRWCSEQGVAALPAGAETVAAFVDAMAKGRATATVRRYVATITAVHRAEGAENAARTEPVRQALSRMHQAKGRRQAQARGLNWSWVRRMLAAGGDSIVEVRNRALLGVAYDTLLRRSELVSLRADDLVLTRDGWATVLVRWAKTDQEGYGAEQWVAPDTVALLRKWFKRSGVTEGPIFRALRNRVVGGALGAREIPRIYREMAGKAGLPPGAVADISGHSTRVGAAQDMVAEGISIASIMQAGRWKTEASVIRYAERMLAQRSGAAQLAKLQGRI